MTSPFGRNIGEATIDVNANTQPFVDDVERAAREASTSADPEFKKAGDHWGETVADSMGDRLEREVPVIGRKFESAISHEALHPHIEVDPDYDYDNDGIERTVRAIARDVERNFARETGSGGTFNNIGQQIGTTIADGIGAGFNVSGRSPLIALLVPFIGAIAALIGAAIEAAYGLGAALLTIPVILSGILLQVGALYLVFKEIGPVISAAFAAKNPKELADALKGVSPPLADFVRQLLQIRDFFDYVGRSAGFQFFTQLGSTLRDIFAAAGGTLANGLIYLAGALGKWFAVVGQAFQSPYFTKFLTDLFLSVDHFLSRNGPQFRDFLERVFIFLDKIIGPADEVGGLFNIWLNVFGKFLVALSKSKGFEAFLDKMPSILADSGDAIAALLDLVLVLFDSFDKAGGQQFLEFFTSMVRILTGIFATQSGIDFLKTMIFLVELLFSSFVGLITVIVAVSATLYNMWLLIQDVAGAVGDFFGNIGGWLEDAGHWLQDFFYKLTGGANPIYTWVQGAKLHFEEFVTTIKGLPQAAVAALVNIGGLLYNAGAALVQGFINGIRSKLSLLGAVAGQIASIVTAHMPGSPAKEGPLSGQGYSLYRGQRMMQDFAKGMLNEAPTLAMASNTAMENINFGPGAINANFYGSNPTPAQANALGSALGTGLGDQLAARNARLAVRTM